MSPVNVSCERLVCIGWVKREGALYPGQGHGGSGDYPGNTGHDAPVHCRAPCTDTFTH